MCECFAKIYVCISYARLGPVGKRGVLEPLELQEL